MAKQPQLRVARRRNRSKAQTAAVGKAKGGKLEVKDGKLAVHGLSPNDHGATDNNRRKDTEGTKVLELLTLKNMEADKNKQEPKVSDKRTKCQPEVQPK